MNLVDSEIRILHKFISFNHRCSRSLRHVDSGFFLFGLRNLRADGEKERPFTESLTLSLCWYEALRTIVAVGIPNERRISE